MPLASYGELPWTKTASLEGVPGLTVTIRQPERDVLQAVRAVAEDSVIHGTWVFEKQKVLSGAHPVTQPITLQETEGADKSFYKAADRVVAPRFFEHSTDVGNITVRYLVKGIGASTTRVQIDAVFTENGRKKAHRSTGAVESAEYEAIESQLKQIEGFKAEQHAAEREVSSSRSASLDEAPEPSPSLPAAYQPAGSSARPLTPSPANGDGLAQLKLQVSELKHKVEMQVKAGQTALKSSPFNGSATLVSLPSGSEVLILIITPHWYGVETQVGQHGWIHASELEPLP